MTAYLGFSAPSDEPVNPRAPESTEDPVPAQAISATIASIAQLEREIAEQEAELAESRKALEEAQKHQETLAKQLEDAQREQAELQRQQEDLQRQLSERRREQDEVARQIRQLEAAQQRLESARTEAANVPTGAMLVIQGLAQTRAMRPEESTTNEADATVRPRHSRRRSDGSMSRRREGDDGQTLEAQARMIGGLLT